MKTENFIYLLVGLVFGAIVGFYVTNKLNSQIQTPTTAAANPVSAPNQPQFPSDHPAVDPKNPITRTAPALPQVQEAIDAAKNQPNNFEAQSKVGDLYYQIKNYDEAAKFYGQANKIKPDAADVWVKIGNVYFDSGNDKLDQKQSGNAEFEQAQTWYEKYLAKNPDDINVRTDLGLTFYLRQPADFDRAIKEYRTSLAKNPNHELTLQNLAVALSKKGDTAALEEVVERMRKVNPNNPVVTGVASPPSS